MERLPRFFRWIVLPCSGVCCSSALGRAYDQFSDQGIVLLPVFARCIQSQLVALASVVTDRSVGEATYGPSRNPSSPILRIHISSTVLSVFTHHQWIRGFVLDGVNDIPAGGFRRQVFVGLGKRHVVNSRCLVLGAVRWFWVLLVGGSCALQHRICSLVSCWRYLQLSLPAIPCPLPSAAHSDRSIYPYPRNVRNCLVHHAIALGLHHRLASLSPGASHPTDIPSQACEAIKLIAYTEHVVRITCRVDMFFMCGAFAHGAIFLVRDSGVGGSAIGFLVANRSAVVSLLSFVCLFHEHRIFHTSVVGHRSTGNVALQVISSGKSCGCYVRNCPCCPWSGLCSRCELAPLVLWVLANHSHSPLKAGFLYWNVIVNNLGEVQSM